jgi:hypothetical protein
MTKIFQEETMNSGSLQKAIFEQIIPHFPNKSEAVEALAEILSLTRESVYRRLRTETLLTPDEIQLLASRFRISIDTLIQQKPPFIPFTYNLFSQPIQDLFSYAGQVYENLQFLLPLKDVQIYYATQEIPIFHYFYYPELFSFKMYIYGLTNWNLISLKGLKFSTRLLPASATDKARECVRIYCTYPTKALWTPNLVDHTLNQIEYIASVNRFDPPELALLLCDQVNQFLERARRMSELGKKFFLATEPSAGNGAFELYYNELASTNNTILVVSPTRQLLYTTFGTPNFLATTDTNLCQHTQDWFEMIISRSTAISVHDAKERDYFFNRMQRKVDFLRKKIKVDQNL